MKKLIQSTSLFLIIFLSSFNLIAQTTYPEQEIKTSVKLLSEKINKIDNLTVLFTYATNDSTTVVKPLNKTIIRTVYDNSKNLNETRTLKHAGVEKVVRIGNGNFKNILYVDKLTNKVIKAQHISIMEHMYNVDEDEKSNTERLEINFYYENEKLFYAVLKEDHYKNGTELFFSNEYNMQMTTNHKDLYFTNDFQKTIYKYIQDTSASILSQK